MFQNFITFSNFLLKYPALFLKVSQRSNPGFPDKKTGFRPVMGITETPSGIRDTGSGNLGHVFRESGTRDPRIRDTGSENPGHGIRESRTRVPGTRTPLHGIFRFR